MSLQGLTDSKTVCVNALVGSAVTRAWTCNMSKSFLWASGLLRGEDKKSLRLVSLTRTVKIGITHAVPGLHCSQDNSHEPYIVGAKVG